MEEDFLRKGEAPLAAEPRGGVHEKWEWPVRARAKASSTATARGRSPLGAVLQARNLQVMAWTQAWHWGSRGLSSLQDLGCIDLQEHPHMAATIL